MVAPKRGRGGRGGAAAKAKAAAAAAVEEPAPEEVPETMEASEDNNGDAAAAEQEAEDNAADQSTEEQPADGEQDAADTEPKPEDKKEEKVESGKLLVENLPASYLFDYQEKLKELFSKHGEVTAVKRGPIIVTEQTTTPTLSAIVEFKNKESLEKALTEEGTTLEGRRITVAVECRADTAVLVGVPYEAGTQYVSQLFAQCGEIAQVHEFSKTKYKILRVTFQDKESVEKALRLDRELRINGFLVTVSKYRDDDEQKQMANANKNKRQHPQQQNNRNNNSLNNSVGGANSAPPAPRNNNFRGGRGGVFNARGNFRGNAYLGGRGRGGGGFPARGGGFPRGGFAGGINNYMPPAYMPRPQGGFMNDGQRPNKRLRQM
ncbi:heterogeneous nuclear ribonucleoproteins A2/B1 isoform X1 [Plutella xylostella]|uniref:heterogeneous nuclear ribonucleoproteins A2/B1 isoform X1 n=1 Tax=Plutella xylostella TaxID=51655 RepID=UPI0020325F6E|nr:heterogeneous nuclear ribonucleoproteins A2/B1 isoform X1 [Plutella xylostella]